MTAPNQSESDKEKDEMLKLIESHCSRLSEHFDTVQIFATKHEPTNSDGTVHFAYGNGNFFARYGQIQLWVKKEEHKE